MTSVLFISPVYFGSNPGISDNAFSGSARVSGQQADSDHIMANVTITEERNRLAELGFHTVLINMKDDPRGAVVYENRGDAIFPNNSISFHNFTDDKGKIVRRVVILYPMSKHRRGELPRVQILNKLDAAANSGAIELVDLRPFEEEDRCLEGTGALNFSPTGRHVYMSRSQRTDDEVLEIVCAPENLNIPEENRFVFASSIPGKSGKGDSVIYHTNILGWVGCGICAWGLSMMEFDSDKDAERFYNHLEEEYEVVLQLNEAEVRGFVGNSLELVRRLPDDREVRVLCMSETAKRSLTEKNLQALSEWYGGEDNIFTFYGEVLERRAGGSVRCTMAMSITHGEALPADGEISTLEVCDIVER